MNEEISDFRLDKRDSINLPELWLLEAGNVIINGQPEPEAVLRRAIGRIYSDVNHGFSIVADMHDADEMLDISCPVAGGKVMERLAAEKLHPAVLKSFNQVRGHFTNPKDHIFPALPKNTIAEPQSAL